VRIHRHGTRLKALANKSARVRLHGGGVIWPLPVATALDPDAVLATAKLKMYAVKKLDKNQLGRGRGMQRPGSRRTVGRSTIELLEL
jgi:hypothetical protein